MKRLLLSKRIQPQVEGTPDFFSRKAIAKDFEGLMDPVIGISHFETTGNMSLPHVHNGISELFYIFPDAAPYQTIDSNGDRIIVPPGSLLWIWAGRGIEHSEGPVRENSRVEGMQIFLNASADKRKYDPGMVIINSYTMPQITAEGINVRLLCGSTGNTSCRIEIPQELSALHIMLEPGKDFLHVLPANWSGTIFALEGRFDSMTQEETFEIEEGMVISMAYSEYNEPIQFTAITRTSLLFVSGLPVQEEHSFKEPLQQQVNLVSANGLNMTEDRQVVVKSTIRARHSMVNI